ncbi:uncharacterized protein LOC115453875 [Manduca sexta]|uniref:uncharacterized protein LOC115453875 n=1 Tax=Manduca sexta TaxID=7130 RepID=UPI00188F14AC|nr:uncharacterized protein LOC115453875 [Manduca sexta]
MPRTARNKRRQTEYFDLEQEEMATPRSTERRRVSVTEGSACITASDIASMMTSLQQAQAEHFERLLDKVLDARQPSCSPACVSPAPATPTSSAQPAPGNFATCKARYSGATSESLDGFIDAVEAFKDCANVSDTNALRGLSMLLTHEAATWWQGVKQTITTWDSALQCLRSVFGDSRPPHRIYVELFSNPQGLQEKTDIFVAKARAHLARLPSGDLTEKVQLDMIYGLLNYNIRKRLRREEFSNFNDFLHKARSIEEATADSQKARADTSKNAAAVTRADTSKGAAVVTRARAISPTPATTATMRPSTQRASYNRQSSTAEGSSRHHIPSIDSNATPMRKASYCVYCKNYGHTRQQCRKLLQSVDRARDSNINNKNNNIISCYGCGESGVIRPNCSKCNSNFSAIDFIPMSSSKPRKYPTPPATAAGKASAHVSNFDTYPMVCTGVVPDSCSRNCSVNFASSNCANVNTGLTTTEPSLINSSYNNESTPPDSNFVCKRNMNVPYKQVKHKSIMNVPSRPVIQGESF